MSKAKMNLGSAGFKDSNQADAKIGIQKAKVTNVVPRPAGFPNKVGQEPIGNLSSSPLRMKGMKGSE